MTEHESPVDAPTAVESEQVSLDPRCPRCNYDLTGTLETDEHICPECGREWTVDELALQHAAHSNPRTRTEWFLWMAAPGPAICVTLIMGLVFSGLIWWVALLACAGFTVLVLAEWSRGLYQHSFARGRTRVGRFIFVVGGTIGLVMLNALEAAGLVFVVLLIRIIITG